MLVQVAIRFSLPSKHAPPNPIVEQQQMDFCTNEGAAVGAAVGAKEGVAVGAKEGVAVGVAVGAKVGVAVGAKVDGAKEGFAVGAKVGAGVGHAVATRLLSENKLSISMGNLRSFVISGVEQIDSEL